MFKHKITAIFYFTIATLASACGNDQGSGEAPKNGGADAQASANLPEPSASPLAGTIHAAAWTFSAGNAKRSRLKGEEDSWLKLQLFGAPLARSQIFSQDTPGVCDFMPQSTDGIHIWVGVPRQVGSFALGMQANSKTIRTATFVYKDTDGTIQNLITAEGRIQIDQLNDQNVVGKMLIRAKDDKNNISLINGQFTVTHCRDEK